MVVFLPKFSFSFLVSRTNKLDVGVGPKFMNRQPPLKNVLMALIARRKLRSEAELFSIPRNRGKQFSGFKQ
jgi:hypothetical protein